MCWSISSRCLELLAETQLFTNNIAIIWMKMIVGKADKAGQCREHNGLDKACRYFERRTKNG